MKALELPYHRQATSLFFAGLLSFVGFLSCIYGIYYTWNLPESTKVVGKPERNSRCDNFRGLTCTLLGLWALALAITFSPYLTLANKVLEKRELIWTWSHSEKRWYLMRPTDLLGLTSRVFADKSERRESLEGVGVVLLLFTFMLIGNENAGARASLKYLDLSAGR